MNSPRSRRSAKPLELEDDGDEVGLVGLVELDEPRRRGSRGDLRSRRCAGGRAARARRAGRPGGARARRAWRRGRPGAPAARRCSVAIFAWRRLIRSCSCAMSLVSDPLGALLARRSGRCVRLDLPLQLVELAAGTGAAARPRGRSAHRASGDRDSTQEDEQTAQRVSAAGHGSRRIPADKALTRASNLHGDVQDALTVRAYTRAMAQSKLALRPDTGLQARMLLTMFLLGAVYVVLIAVAVRQRRGWRDSSSSRRPVPLPAVHLRQARAGARWARRGLARRRRPSCTR